MAKQKFPEWFYWGAATASYQVEGGIENCDWAKAAREGKVPVCGAACEHYTRYEADFAIAKSLGHNCHRLSVEWARIEPEEGKFDEKEIEHYRRVLRALRERGLEPFITLWHFTLPLWFSESGGFERKDAPTIFARYCAYVVERLGEQCAHYATINEPLSFTSNGWRRGTWPPFERWPLIKYAGVSSHTNILGMRPPARGKNVLRYFSVLKTLTRAHNAAHDAIKMIAPQAEVGIVHQILFFHANNNPLNQFLAWFMNWHWTYSFMDKVVEKCDVIGVNYYLHNKFGDTAVYDKTDMGWDVYPEGLEEALLMLARYNKPLYVSEAGVADAKDRIRGDYITRLVAAMGRALARGADVRGFMYWSLLDNYEWAFGFMKRFGLVEIDYETQKRTIRASAFVYKKIIEQNGMLE